MKKETQNTNKGITLIALVITIIVLLILAGVAINMAINSDGLFGKANDAVESWNDSADKDKDEVISLMREMFPMKVWITNNSTNNKIHYGDELVFTMYTEGLEGIDYIIQWQESHDKGATWIDIPGANRN